MKFPQEPFRILARLWKKPQPPQPSHVSLLPERKKRELSELEAKELLEQDVERSDIRGKFA